MSTIWWHKFLMKWSMTLKVIQGHIRPHLCQNHSSTFVYEVTIFSLNYIWPRMHFYDMEKCICDFITLKPSDLNITLTYVLMEKLLSLFYFNANIDINSHDIYFKHRYADLVWWILLIRNRVLLEEFLACTQLNILCILVLSPFCHLICINFMQGCRWCTFLCYSRKFVLNLLLI